MAEAASLHEADTQSMASMSMTSSPIKDVPVIVLPSKLVQEFRVSMAYEKSLTKEKCSLCLMFFNRKTVCYKVPNHRLFEMQKMWSRKNGCKDIAEKEGRRYENPSFLYQSTTVCSFCAQLFSQLPHEVNEDPNRDGGYGIFGGPAHDPDKLTLSATLERQDIAVQQHAYQSSDVDGKVAQLALTPPYSACSRTRREADPWWEMEFGRFMHVHSLAFDIRVGVRARVEVWALLLRKPVGFEDPFLDSAKGQAALAKSFVFEAQSKAYVGKAVWELPEHLHCYAIRLQVKGVTMLSLSRVQAFQGDDLVVAREADAALSTESMASLSLQSIRAGMKEMMSPKEKMRLVEHQPTPIGHQAFDHVACEEAVQRLKHQIQVRYEHVDSWKVKVLAMAKIFSEEGVRALHRVVFKFVSDMNLTNASHHPLGEHELLAAGLTAHYPRCDLTELHQRLRSVVRWLQTRSHMKVLGALLDCEPLTYVCNLPSDQLYHLMTAFKRVEYFWNKREHQEQLAVLIQEPGGPPMGRAKVSEARGCSWGQFVLIMALFCKQQCERIPEEVFNIEKRYARQRMATMLDEHSHISVGSGDGRSVSSYSLSIMKPNPVLQPGRAYDPNAQRLGQKEVAFSESPFRITPQAIEDARRAASSGDTRSLESWSVASMPWLMAKSEVSASKSLVDAVRERGHPAPYDSSFAEYKFGHLKKKLSRDVAFPKTLSLEFARTLLSHKGATVSMQTADQLMLGGQLEGSSVLGGDDDDASRGSNTSSITGIGSFDLPSAPLPKLHRGMSMMGKSSRFSVDCSVGGDESRASPVPGLTPSKSARNLGVRASTAASVGASLEGLPPSQLLRAMTSATVKTKASSVDKRSLTMPRKDELDDLDDLISESEKSQHRAVSKELTAIDFFRICALCEVRFPRSAVEFKVVRKHIVQLRSSWDPALVSREVRSLDNTISMYNLYYVCVFCAQFFDPDFPDGIAYPTRQAGKVSSGNRIADSLSTEGSTTLTPYYDTRHQPNVIEVGSVLSRPRTVESRRRARRALEVAQEMEEKQKALQRVMSANEEMLKRLT